MDRIDAATILALLLVVAVTSYVFEPLDGVVLGGVLGFFVAAVLRGRRINWDGA